MDNSAPPIQYWVDVKDEMQKITAAAAQQSLQPRDGTVYITSRASRKFVGAKAGVVCLANLKLAGQKLVEESHTLSTDAEIKAFQKDAEERKREILAERTKTSLTFAQVPRDPAEAVKGA